MLFGKKGRNCRLKYATLKSNRRIENSKDSAMVRGREKREMQQHKRKIERVTNVDMERENEERNHHQNGKQLHLPIGP